MKRNDNLRIHVINVGHGDSILVEFPDYTTGQQRKPRFGLVDGGGLDSEVKNKTLDYVNKFVRCRLEDDPSHAPSAEDFIFEFICLTHPHKDHLYGILPLLNAYCAQEIPVNHRPREFWDCGFRYNTVGYLGLLQYLRDHREVQFIRVTSGTEFHYDDVEVLVLAPSVDLRNRYDTYGVDLNDASIVLRLSRGNGVAVLTGDAHFDSWGKVCEEFPRKKHLTYPPVRIRDEETPDVRDPNHPAIVFLSKENQLNCQFLKIAHHGSKRGTSYEYIEKLSPSSFAITCDKDEWYESHQRSWVGKFPHPITRLIIGEQTDQFEVDDPRIPDIESLGDKIGTSNMNGTMIFTIKGNGNVVRKNLNDERNEMVDEARLGQAL